MKNLIDTYINLLILGLYDEIDLLSAKSNLLIPGPRGPKGDKGDPGDPGTDYPGGLEGQVLMKLSDLDFDADWQDEQDPLAIPYAIALG